MRNMLILCVSLLAIAGGLLAAAPMAPQPSDAQDVIVCDFTGTEPSSNTPWTKTSFLAPGVSFAGWDLGAGTYPVSGANDVFGYYVSTTAEDSTLAQAIAEDEYIGFSIAATAGTLDLNGTKVSFSIQRLSWWAPRTYAVFTSVGGFVAGAELFTTASTAHGDFDEHHHAFIIPLSGYGGISGPVEFRIYGFDARYATHGTSLTAFSITDPGPLYTLILDADPGGSVSSDPQGALFEAGTVVELLAEPHTGFQFAGWSGDVTGFGNPRAITMNSNIATTGGFAANPEPDMTIGINLGAVNDWSSSWDFVDVFKMSREWLTRSVGGSEWDSGMSAEIPCDPNGWPTELPFLGSDGKQHYVHTLLPPTVLGDYTLIVDGSGRVRLKSGGASQEYIAAGGGSSTFTYTPPGSGGDTFYIEIHESASVDPIRNVRVIRPGFAGVYQTHPFHPLYTQRLEPFVALRFMDSGKTNFSPLVSWADRTTPDTHTQTRPEGMALEYMILLANTLGQDPWICVPHLADDDYVRRAARLLRDQVDPALKIYVEYSNETWNSMFSQTTYVQDMGEALGLSPDRWQAGQIYCALRSVQIWEIFQEEFVDEGRLIEVMATQSASISITDTRFDALNDPAINPSYIMPDALGIAPYFGKIYTPGDIPPAVPDYPTVDDILDVLSPALIAEERSVVIAQKTAADRQGAVLVCYEGGQHFVGAQGAENDATLTAILHEANADPRMYMRYIEYLDMLHKEGVAMFGHYLYVGNWSKWGSWGALEVQDQPFVDAHKYRALIEWRTLMAAPASLSAGAGGVVDFVLEVGAPGAGRRYVLAGGMSGSSPGTLLPGGLAIVPINSDALTDFILNHLSGSYFQGFHGTLDPAGSGTARFDTLGPLHPGFAGTTLTFAYALRDPWDQASNPVTVKILP